MTNDMTNRLINGSVTCSIDGGVTVYDRYALYNHATDSFMAHDSIVSRDGDVSFSIEWVNELNSISVILEDQVVTLQGILRRALLGLSYEESGDHVADQAFCREVIHLFEEGIMVNIHELQLVPVVYRVGWDNGMIAGKDRLGVNHLLSESLLEFI